MLRALSGLLQTLERHRILAQIDVGLFLEVQGEPIHDDVVEVFATQERIAVGGLDLEDPVPDLEDRDIERASTEIEDHDLLVRGSGEPGRQRFLGLLKLAPGHRSGGIQNEQDLFGTHRLFHRRHRRRAVRRCAAGVTCY